jgi:hypothetical protein
VEIVVDQRTIHTKHYIARFHRTSIDHIDMSGYRLPSALITWSLIIIVMNEPAFIHPERETRKELISGLTEVGLANSEY